MTFRPGYFVDECRSRSCYEPGSLLRAQTIGRNVSNVTVLDFKARRSENHFSTSPFIDLQAKPSEFNATYWVETVQPKLATKPVLQLQYAQSVLLAFNPRFDCTGHWPGPEPPPVPPKDCNKMPDILWPHVQVATLHKQPDVSV